MTNRQEEHRPSVMASAWQWEARRALTQRSLRWLVGAGLVVQAIAMAAVAAYLAYGLGSDVLAPAQQTVGRRG